MGKQKLHKPAVVSPVKGKQTPPKKVTTDSDEDSSSSSEEEVGKFLQRTTIQKITAVTKPPGQKQPPTSGADKLVTVESSSDDEDSDSDVEELPQKTKQISPAKKQSEVQQTKQISPAKKQSEVQQTKQISPAKKQSEVQQTKQISPAKKQSKVPQQTKQISPAKKQSVPPVNAKAAGQKAQVVDSSSEEEDDSDEDDSDAVKEAPKAVKQIPQQKKQVPQVNAKAAGQKAQVVESSSEEEDDSDEDDSDAEKGAPKAVRQIPQQKKQVPQVGAKAAGQTTQAAESSSEEEDDSDEDDSEEEKPAPKSVKQISPQKTPGAVKQAQVEDSEEDSSEDDEEDSSEDEEEEDEIPAGKTAKVTKSINGVKTALTKKTADVEDSDEDEEESEEEDDSEEDEEEVETTHKRKGDKAKEQPPAKKQKLKGGGGDALNVPESKKRKKEEIKKEPASKKQKREAVNGSEGPVTLYVGRLAKDTTEEEITSFFSKHNISLAEVRKFKSNAFVDLEDADDLEDALALNGSTFKNGTIAVERAKPRTSAQATVDKKIPSTFIPGDTSNKPENEKDSRTLFVKNLPESATSESLKSIFDSALYIRIPMKEGVHKGFGFVEFADKTSMEAAMSENQGVEFEGSSLFLDYVGSRSTLKKQHARSGTSPGRGGSRQANAGARGESKVLFVGNLSYSTDESSLKASFQGAVSARIPTFQDSGKSKGFAFVDFPTVEAAAKAFDTMTGRSIDGRQVTVDFAVDKSAGGAGGRGGFSSRGRGGRGGGKSFRGGAAGSQKGRGGFNKARGGMVQPQGKKTKFSEDSD